MEIQFGMLQQLKAKGLKAQGANAGQQKLNVNNAESVFQQYEQYKTQLAEAEQNGGQTGGSTGTAFGSTSLSVDELNAKMTELESEFNKYYTAMNDMPGEKPDNGDSKENDDEKNKLKPKEFGSMMA